jgi:hypothetical protein
MLIQRVNKMTATRSVAEPHQNEAASDPDPDSSPGRKNDAAADPTPNPLFWLILCKIQKLHILMRLRLWPQQGK